MPWDSAEDPKKFTHIGCHRVHSADEPHGVPCSPPQRKEVPKPIDFGAPPPGEVERVIAWLRSSGWAVERPKAPSTNLKPFDWKKSLGTIGEG